MLRLTLEIVPQGREIAKRTIGVMKIVNVTKGFDVDDDLGDYKFSFTTETTTHTGTLGKWPRRLGAWKLVQTCLQVIHGESPLKEPDNGNEDN
jgi:hypothetical protein